MTPMPEVDIVYQALFAGFTLGFPLGLLVERWRDTDD